jgi:hypothetical protein
VTDYLDIETDVLALQKAYLTEDDMGYGAVVLASDDPEHLRELIAGLVCGWCELLVEGCGHERAVSLIEDMQKGLQIARLVADEQAER